MELISELRAQIHRNPSKEEDNVFQKKSQCPSIVYRDDIMDLWYKFDSKFHLPGNFQFYLYLVSRAMTRTVSQ